MYTDFIQTLEVKNQINTQHNGLGRKLLKKAEQIAFENGYNKISVISGVGVRNYKRHGYSLDQNTMKNYMFQTFRS